MRLIYLPLLSALLVLSGCSSVKSTVKDWFGNKDDATGPAKLVEFGETAKFEVRWHTDLGDSDTSLLQPVLTRDAIYGASGKGELARVDRATGKQVWRVESGIAISGGVGSGDGLVLVGSDKGEVLAYG